VFRAIFQWIGVTTAVPVVVLLGTSVWLTMRPYRFRRLRLVLICVVHEDLLRILQPAAGQSLADVVVRRSEQLDLARRNLIRKVEHSDPGRVARFWNVWIAIEVARVMVYAFRRVGVQTTGMLVRRAGQDVTTGSVIGLVVGILVWYLVSRYQGDFYDYLGGSVTLGAFVGLAFTSVAVTREAAVPMRRLFAGWLVLAAIQVLMYLKPSWSPGPPQK
jgi:Na+/H+ antiporter NhaC